MAKEKLISPPLRKPVQEYLTPDFSVGYFTELIDRSDPAYKTPVRGMPYSSIRDAKQWVVAAFPNLYFVRESRWHESDQYVLWIFGSDPKGEDTYNAEDTYGLEDSSKPGYIRVYNVRREVYNAAPALTPLTPLKTIISITVTAQGDGYTFAEVTAANGASITPVISGGKIVSLVLTAQGSDVTSAPIVTIAGDGTGAAATAVIQTQSAVLVRQEKKELPEQHPLRNEYVQVIRTYSTLPGATLTEVDYIAEINSFIKTEKTVVAKTSPHQAGSRSGGTGGADLVVTEYKDIDANQTIKIVATFPAAIIGSSWTFRAPLSFAIPAEISVKPEVKVVRPPTIEMLIATYTSYAAAISMDPDFRDAQIARLRKLVSNMALDFAVRESYTKNFSATVTRSLDMESTTETELNMVPEGYSRVSILKYLAGDGDVVSPDTLISTLVPVHIPSCIHPSWVIEIGQQIDLEYVPGVGAWGGGWMIKDSDLPINIYLPQTSPSEIPYGQVIIAKVASSLWRGGLYVNDIYRIMLPYPAPVISPMPQDVTGGSGWTGGGLSVTITARTGTTINYTTDGSEPSRTNGFTYSSGITLAAPATIKAMCYNSAAGSDSPISSSVYT